MTEIECLDAATACIHEHKGNTEGMFDYMDEHHKEGMKYWNPSKIKRLADFHYPQTPPQQTAPTPPAKKPLNDYGIATMALIGDSATHEHLELDTNKRRRRAVMWLIDNGYIGGTFQPRP